MNRRGELREAIQRLDVATAPRIAAKLRELLELWPAAASLFEPRIRPIIAAIRKQQRKEQQKWLQMPQ